jgi:hypothetical protein
MREMHAVFVAIDLHALGDAIVLVGEVGEAARVAGPHVPLGLALGHPFGQHLAGAAALAMPKVKTQASNALGTPGIGPISGLPSGV